MAKTITWLSVVRTILLCYWVITVVTLNSCRDCENCSSSFPSETEKRLIYQHRTELKYSNGSETITINIDRSLSEPPAESCASFPLLPVCSSFGYARIDTTGFPVNFVHEISTQKNSGKFTCTLFEIGNTFFLNMNTSYKLSAINPNQDVINDLGQYVYNGVAHNNAQEILRQTPIGNVHELVRAVYLPSEGVVELTYANPSSTWTLVP